MKPKTGIINIVALCCFLIVNQVGFSQGLNTEIGYNANYGQSPKDIACSNEFTYLVRNQNYSSFFTGCFIDKIDTTGNIIWSFDVFPVFAEVYDAQRIIISENGEIYISGYGVPTCDVGMDCFSFIQKIDANGITEWTSFFPTYYCYSIEITGLTLNSSQNPIFNYVDYTGSHVLELNADNGEILETLDISPEQIEGFSESSNYQLIGFKQDSLYGFDTNGNVISEIYFNTNISNVIERNDSLLVLTSDSIYWFNNNLELLLGTSVSDYANYSNLKIINGEIKIISSNLEGIDLLTLNNQFDLLDFININVGLSEINYKDFSQSHLSIGDNFPLTMFTSIRYIDYSLQSNHNEIVNTTDIGIVDIIENDVLVVPESETSDVYTINHDISVLIKNFGPNDLNNCRINRFISWWICSPIFYTQTFYNLNLAPNDSIWINLGWISEMAANYPSDTAIVNFCAYTSHPNYVTDLNISNDEDCKDFLVVLVGVEEQEDLSFKLFPNPTNNFVTIESIYKTGLYYSVYNTYGVFISKGITINKMIDLSSLSPGLYFINLSMDNKNFIIKKVFVH